MARHTCKLSTRGLSRSFGELAHIVAGTLSQLSVYKARHDSAGSEEALNHKQAANACTAFTAVFPEPQLSKF